ncbi:hypothetical protein VNO77_15869 [Canavalia gladiata]|uniref:Uncharacterized protein n=1 Tax=Canavalia gladiata TaxID=3824 RepID=A0AAN9LZY2_CANGL
MCNIKITKFEFPDELVRGSKVGKVFVGVGESETYLNQMQAVHVSFQYVVVAFRDDVHDDDDDEHRMMSLDGRVGESSFQVPSPSHGTSV